MKNEIIWSLLNQNLLTCVMTFMEIIEIDKDIFSMTEVINAIVIEKLNGFSDLYLWLDDDCFEDYFNEDISNFQKNVLHKSKLEKNVNDLFGDILNLYSKTFDCEVSLEDELELRRYYDSIDEFIWTQLDVNMLDGLYSLIKILKIKPLLKNGDSLVDDIILSTLKDFIIASKNDEEYQDWISWFKNSIMKISKNNEKVIEISGDLVLLEYELSNRKDNK